MGTSLNRDLLSFVDGRQIIRFRRRVRGYNYDSWRGRMLLLSGGWTSLTTSSMQSACMLNGYTVVRSHYTNLNIIS